MTDTDNIWIINRLIELKCPQCGKTIVLTNVKGWALSMIQIYETKIICDDCGFDGVLPSNVIEDELNE